MFGVVDQEPVQALPPDGAYPTLRVGVGPARLRRRDEYLDPLGVEHRVEHAGALGVSVTDQEPEPG